MIKYWKTRTINNLSEFLILNQDSIWIAKIDENEISIDRAIEEKKLFGKTNFYRFSELESILFDEDNFCIILDYLADDDGKKEKAVKINVQKTDYKDIKTHLTQIFPKNPIKDLSFFDKQKPMIIAFLSTIGITIIMYYTSGISLKTIGIISFITIVEIIILKKFGITPKNGQILKLN